MAEIIATPVGRPVIERQLNAGTAATTARRTIRAMRVDVDADLEAAAAVLGLDEPLARPRHVTIASSRRPTVPA